jgi:hypothetical protein
MFPTIYPVSLLAPFRFKKLSLLETVSFFKFTSNLDLIFPPKWISGCLLVILFSILFFFCSQKEPLSRVLGQGENISIVKIVNCVSVLSQRHTPNKLFCISCTDNLEGKETETYPCFSCSYTANERCKMINVNDVQRVI